MNLKDRIGSFMSGKSYCGKNGGLKRTVLGFIEAKDAQHRFDKSFNAKGWYVVFKIEGNEFNRAIELKSFAKWAKQEVN